ncbi:MAG TPA: ABC transporter ATP-binding protein [Solirubrobacterales bacterium]|jgi:putative spermidine/putrescine transport system ATP-binding protein
MPESRGAGLRVEGAVKRFGEVVALDGVSVDVRPGEFLTLLGPSGSGKTTMLNAIAGFADLSEGEIYLDGAPVAPIPTHKRNVGVIFQSYALFPHMTATANVAYPLKQRGLSREERDRRVAEALHLVGLGDIGHRYPRELSGGQQQRVAFARAIVFNPRLLLMDEPLGALDRKLRESLQREIKTIHRDLGITFVYVTHDQSEALALSDRIAVFRQGRIEQIGTPEELYERPANRFVAEFMGESNILAGEGCCYVIRPQAIRLGEAGLGNERRGRVADVSYLGASRRVAIEAGGVSYLVRQDAASTPAPAIDEEVTFGWRNEDVLVVPDGPAAEPEDAAAASGNPSGTPRSSPQTVLMFNNPTDEE